MSLKPYLLAAPSHDTIPAKQMPAVRRAARGPFLQAQRAIPPCAYCWRDVRHVKDCPVILLCRKRWCVFLTSHLKHIRDTTVVNEDVVLAVRHALPPGLVSAEVSRPRTEVADCAVE